MLTGALNQVGLSTARAGAARTAKAACFGLALAMWSAPSLADPVITNWPNGTDGGSTVSAINWKALVFTAGSTATFSGVELGLNPNSGGVPTTAQVEVALYTVVGGVPAAQVATTGLVSVSLPALQGGYSLATGGAFSVTAGQTYALVVRSDAGQIKWGNTSPATSPTAAGGFAFGGFLQTVDSGASWSTPAGQVNAVRLSVPTSVPALSPWAVLLMALVLAALAWQVMARRASLAA
jgi:hypothetical protein